MLLNYCSTPSAFSLPVVERLSVFFFCGLCWKVIVGRVVHVTHLCLPWYERNICRVLTLTRLGYFGGWIEWGKAMMSSPLRSRPWYRAIAAKICTMVVCDVIYKIEIFRFSKIFLFYFILINYANLCCVKSDFLLLISK